MIVMFFKVLFRLPVFILLEIQDHIRAKKEHWSERFEGWGLHLYVGKFGAGKTCTMVHDAYILAKRYPNLTILSNFAIYNFPDTVTVLPLHTAKDIIDAPDNTLILIDEIGTIFNSRDFSVGKQSIPKILFQHICQCRKRHKMILATAQRWNFLDKQLRDIAATVNVTRSHFSHPFTRMNTVYAYDAVEYDLAFTNPLYPIRPVGCDAYIQSDALRNRYDTSELVETMLNSEYISDAEIRANRGEDGVSMQEVDKKGYRRSKKVYS